MNITKEQTGELTATIQINLQHTDLESDVTKALKDYQRKATIPGFRPGHVPFGMVKKMYGSSVMAEQVNKSVSKALNDYIEDEKIAILGHPIANIEKTGTLDFDNQTDYNFYFDIGLSPEFDLNLESVQLEYSKIIAGDKQIEETVNNMLERNPIHTHPETVGEEDEIEASIGETDHAGNEIEDGLKSEIRFKVNSVIDEESKSLFVGKTDGAEFVIDLEKALGTEKLADLVKWPAEAETSVPSSYNLIIKEIHHEEKAILNEDFFETIFPEQNITTLEAFRFKVAEGINLQLESESERHFANKAIDGVIDQIKFSLPTEFLHAWVLQNAEGKLTKEQLEEDAVQYDRTFRWQVIEGKLMEENPNLAVTKDEIRTAVKRQFFGQFMNPDQYDEDMDHRMEPIVDMILKNKDESNKIAEKIAEQKFASYIKEKAQITVKEVTYDTFIESFNKNKNDNDE